MDTSKRSKIVITVLRTFLSTILCTNLCTILVVSTAHAEETAEVQDPLLDDHPPTAEQMAEQDRPYVAPVKDLKAKICTTMKDIKKGNDLVTNYSKSIKARQSVIDETNVVIRQKFKGAQILQAEYKQKYGKSFDLDSCKK